MFSGKPFLVVASLALLLGACSSAEGGWQSREPLTNGKRNSLWIDPSGQAELKMYARLSVGAELSKLRYVGDWQLNANDAYELDLSCKDGCIDGMKLDFAMDCKFYPDYADLDCKAGSPFETYGFFEFETLQ